MTVKQLINKLKKMPPGAAVAFSAHDNSIWEIADWVNSVDLFDKRDPDYQPPDYISDVDRQWYDDQPNKAVVLKG